MGVVSGWWRLVREGLGVSSLVCVPRPPVCPPGPPQIEYDLLRSSKDHLELLDIHRVAQGSFPTCMVWYPPLAKELFLLVCDSDYKVKLFNSTTKMCR